jgi:hypothetical protein
MALDVLGHAELDAAPARLRPTEARPPAQARTVGIVGVSGGMNRRILQNMLGAGFPLTRSP